MVVSDPKPSPFTRAGRRYLRAPVPLFFPERETVVETRDHRLVGERIAQSIEHESGGTVLVSSDQFLYWDATNPKRCLAPDVAIRTGSPSALVDTWKTWERGAPQVGVEVVSPSDASERRFEEKLERYRQAGVLEVVRYHAADRARPIRIWDSLEGDMVERELGDPEALRCDALGWYWCEQLDPKLGFTLRLSRTPDCKDLVKTSEESLQIALDLVRTSEESLEIALEAERAALETERAAKEAALTRIAELEAELARSK